MTEPDWTVIEMYDEEMLAAEATEAMKELVKDARVEALEDIVE